MCGSLAGGRHGSWVVDAVAEVPGGAEPSYAHGYTERDNAYYRSWDDISRERETFTAWLHEEVLGTARPAPEGTAT